MEVESVSCECCGLEEECTGEWLCGLCSEAVKYEAGKCKGAPDVEEAVRAHMAICRTLKMSGGPAGRVADGMRQILRTASWKKAAGASSSPRGHHRASPPLSVGL
nr:unnamed protein product [Digitaria exilis]